MLFRSEGFGKVVNSCPVPIVIAGGKKLEEKDALELCYKAINEGACGVDMGRNVFQSDSPVAMSIARKYPESVAFTEKNKHIVGVDHKVIGYFFEKFHA